MAAIYEYFSQFVAGNPVAVPISQFSDGQIQATAPATIAADAAVSSYLINLAQNPTASNAMAIIATNTNIANAVASYHKYKTGYAWPENGWITEVPQIVNKILATEPAGVVNMITSINSQIFSLQDATSTVTYSAAATSTVAMSTGSGNANATATTSGAGGGLSQGAKLGLGLGLGLGIPFLIAIVVALFYYYRVHHSSAALGSDAESIQPMTQTGGAMSGMTAVSSAAGTGTGAGGAASNPFGSGSTTTGAGTNNASGAGLNNTGTGAGNAAGAIRYGNAAAAGALAGAAGAGAGAAASRSVDPSSTATSAGASKAARTDFNGGTGSGTTAGTNAAAAGPLPGATGMGGVAFDPFGWGNTTTGSGVIREADGTGKNNGGTASAAGTNQHGKAGTAGALAGAAGAGAVTALAQGNSNNGDANFATGDLVDPRSQGRYSTNGFANESAGGPNTAANADPSATSTGPISRGYSHGATGIGKDAGANQTRNTGTAGALAGAAGARAHANKDNEGTDFATGKLVDPRSQASYSGTDGPENKLNTSGYTSAIAGPSAAKTGSTSRGYEPGDARTEIYNAWKSNGADSGLSPDAPVASSDGARGIDNRGSVQQKSDAVSGGDLGQESSEAQGPGADARTESYNVWRTGSPVPISQSVAPTMNTYIANNAASSDPDHLTVAQRIAMGTWNPTANSNFGGDSQNVANIGGTPLTTGSSIRGIDRNALLTPALGTSTARYETSGSNMTNSGTLSDGSFGFSSVMYGGAGAAGLGGIPVSTPTSRGQEPTTNTDNFDKNRTGSWNTDVSTSKYVHISAGQNEAPGLSSDRCGVSAPFVGSAGGTSVVTASSMADPSISNTSTSHGTQKTQFGTSVVPSNGGDQSATARDGPRSHSNGWTFSALFGTDGVPDGSAQDIGSDEAYKSPEIQHFAVGHTGFASGPPASYTADSANPRYAPQSGPQQTHEVASDPADRGIANESDASHLNQTNHITFSSHVAPSLQPSNGSYTTTSIAHPNTTIQAPPPDSSLHRSGTRASTGTAISYSSTAGRSGTSGGNIGSTTSASDSASTHSSRPSSSSSHSPTNSSFKKNKTSKPATFATGTAPGVALRVFAPESREIAPLGNPLTTVTTGSPLSAYTGTEMEPTELKGGVTEFDKDLVPQNTDKSSGLYGLDPQQASIPAFDDPNTSQVFSMQHQGATPDASRTRKTPMPMSQGQIVEDSRGILPFHNFNAQTHSWNKVTTSPQTGNLSTDFSQPRSIDPVDHSSAKVHTPVASGSAIKDSQSTIFPKQHLQTISYQTSSNSAEPSTSITSRDEAVAPDAAVYRPIDAGQLVDSTAQGQRSYTTYTYGQEADVASPGAFDAGEQTSVGKTQVLRSLNDSRSADAGPQLQPSFLPAQGIHSGGFQQTPVPAIGTTFSTQANEIITQTSQSQGPSTIASRNILVPRGQDSILALRDVVASGGASQLPAAELAALARSGGIAQSGSSIGSGSGSGSGNGAGTSQMLVSEDSHSHGGQTIRFGEIVTSQGHRMLSAEELSALASQGQFEVQQNEMGRQWTSKEIVGSSGGEKHTVTSNRQISTLGGEGQLSAEQMMEMLRSQGTGTEGIEGGESRVVLEEMITSSGEGKFEHGELDAASQGTFSSGGYSSTVRIESGNTVRTETAMCPAIEDEGKGALFG